MVTTALFVELIVIGVSATAWVALLVLAIFGYSWLTFERFSSLSTVVPLLSLSYLLGIITDRFADRLFEPASSRLLTRWFASQSDYRHAQSLVYADERFQALAEYSKSRLRICRGSAVNCVLLSIALNMFVWLQLPIELPRAKLSIVGSVLLILVGLGALSAWYQLCVAGYERLHQQAMLLGAIEGKPTNGSS